MAPPPQPFLHPQDLFRAHGEGEACCWTCARTRPRWEKKFARWLADRAMHHFLPVVSNLTVSGRKSRTNLVPLFPGYVFVAGRHAKGDFDRTGDVVRVIHPEGPDQIAQLHRELTGIWQGLNTGLYVQAVQAMAMGERCAIVRGPMQGHEAQFERLGRQGRVILQVQLMGGGLAVDVSADDIDVMPADAPR